MSRLIFMDGETYYDDVYSLSKMTPAEYILDPRWELILMAVREGVNGTTYTVEGPDFPRWVADAQPTAPNTATVTFNTLFDGSYMAWRYGYLPRTLIDVMGMARAVCGHELPRVSLEAVAEHLKIGVKGDTVKRVKGLHREDIKQRGMWEEFCGYARKDVDLTCGAFQILFPHIPRSELKFMDLVLRCCIEPRFVANKRLLYDHYTEVVEAKRKLIDSTGIADPYERLADAVVELNGDNAALEFRKQQLRSDAKFAKLLEERGVTIQYKTTKKGNTKPQFAKVDPFMIELEEHPDPQVQALVAARLGLRSTLEETRSKRLLSICSLPLAGTSLNLRSLPIPLRISGAHTHRLSGDWKLNMQNLPRGGKLRKSLCAKRGEQVVVADLKQIEARVNAWICGQRDLVETFRNKGDPYSDLATDIFGRKINRKLPEDFAEGFIGKTGVLGLGFGCAAPRFYDMVRGDSHKMGVDLKGMWTMELATTSVQTYRRKNDKIRASWRKLGLIVSDVWATPGRQTATFGPVTIGYGWVSLPNGMYMKYREPHKGNLPAQMVEVEPGLIEPDGNGREIYIYGYGRQSNLLMNGPKMLENIVQALARIVCSTAALAISYRGYNFCHQEHDALAWIVPENEVDKVIEIVKEEMRKAPPWAPDLPVDIDIGHGPNFGDAKP